MKIDRCSLQTVLRVLPSITSDVIDSFVRADSIRVWLANVRIIREKDEVAGPIMVLPESSNPTAVTAILSEVDTIVLPLDVDGVPWHSFTFEWARMLQRIGSCRHDTLAAAA